VGHLGEVFYFKYKPHMNKLYEQVYMGLLNGYFCFFYPLLDVGGEKDEQRLQEV